MRKSRLLVLGEDEVHVTFDNVYIVHEPAVLAQLGPTGALHFVQVRMKLSKPLRAEPLRF